MKDKRGKRNVYIKIICRKPILVFYTLKNTVTTLKGWLNIRNLMWVNFCVFLKFFLNIEKGMAYKASVASTLSK